LAVLAEPAFRVVEENVGFKGASLVDSKSEAAQSFANLTEVLGQA
jgi:hypothetical protein